MSDFIERIAAAIPNLVILALGAWFFLRVLGFLDRT